MSCAMSGGSQLLVTLATEDLPVLMTSGQLVMGQGKVWAFPVLFFPMMFLYKMKRQPLSSFCLPTMHGTLQAYSI